MAAREGGRIGEGDLSGDTGGSYTEDRSLLTTEPDDRSRDDLEVLAGPFSARVPLITPSEERVGRIGLSGETELSCSLVGCSSPLLTRVSKCGFKRIRSFKNCDHGTNGRGVKRTSFSGQRRPSLSNTEKTPLHNCL